MKPQNMKEGEDNETGVNLMCETQAIEEEFINTYRKLSVLWDTENEHYTNKTKRNAALDILLKIIKKWNPSANRHNVRQKINVIRSVYRKDLKKYLASKRYSSDGEVYYDYEPRNWKFHALRFLDNVMTTDITTEKSDIGLIEINLSDNNCENIASSESSSENEESSSQIDVLADLNECEDLEPEEQNEQTNRLLKHRNKRIKTEAQDDWPIRLDQDQEQNERKKHLLKYRNKRIIKTEAGDCYAESYDLLDREFDAIGANVSCKLKRMNPEQRYHAELLINRVLISGLKKHLTDDTDLMEVCKP